MGYLDVDHEARSRSDIAEDPTQPSQVDLSVAYGHHERITETVPGDTGQGRTNRIRQFANCLISQHASLSSAELVDTGDTNRSNSAIVAEHLTLPLDNREDLRPRCGGGESGERIELRRHHSGRAASLGEAHAE
jgi:hypothetical protein